MTTKTLSLIAASLLLSNTLYAEETLQDITVTTANKTPQSLQSVTSNVEVITAEDIEERGYTTVAEALDALPGISVVSNGGLGKSTTVYLRGMDSKRILVLIDGIRVNDITGLSGAPFEHLLVEDIEQIEVVKGAQSGLWGADASAGVINIITKGAKQGVHSSMKLEAGSFKTKKYSSYISSATQNYYFTLSHNVVDTDGFSALAPDMDKLDQYEDDGYTNKTTDIAFGYHFNKNNTIKLSHKIIDAKSDYDTFGNPDGIATSETKDSFSSVRFEHTDSFNTLNLYANLSKFDRSYTAPDYTGVVKTTPYEGEIKEYGINSKMTYRDEDFVLIGADYKKFSHDKTIGKSYNNKGLFLTNTNIFSGMLGGKTILNESLRYDNYSSFDNKVTGKIGIKHIHEAIKGLSTSVNYGTAYNIPTLYQLFSPYGNDALSPETTKTFDITLAYKDFKASYFYNKIEDMIDFDMSSYKYANLPGNSKISGIELAYQKEIHEGLFFSLNYTHLINAEDNQGKALKRRPKDDAHLALDYYGIDSLHVGIEAAYVGSRKDTKFNPDFSTTEVDTGKYTLINLSADYKINDNFTLYGKIENLADKKYQSVYNYAGTPRGFYVGLKARF